MRLKLTLFLALLNIALFSYIIYLDRGKGGDNRWKDAERLVFAPGLISGATELRIEGTQIKQPWHIIRKNKQWFVTQPISWSANPYATSRLLDLLNTLQWETQFPVDSLAETGRSLADYGLDEQATLLEITQEANQTVKLKIGAPTKIGQRVYVLVDGLKQIYVVPRSLIEAVAMDPELLLSRKIIQIESYEARTVNLQNNSPSGTRVQLSHESGQWVLSTPIRVAADTIAVNQAIDALAEMQVDAFVPAAIENQGLATPTFRIHLTGNNRQQTLLLGNIANPGAIPLKRFAKLESQSTVFTIPVEPLEIWQNAQESLRDRQFIQFDPKKVSDLQISFDTQTISLQKLESGQWQRLLPSTDGQLKTIPADRSTIDRILQRLSELKALQFVSDAPASTDLDRFGFNELQRKAQIGFENGEKKTLLIGQFLLDDLGRTGTNRIYAKCESTPSIYLTTASILSELSLDPLVYRERFVGILPTGTVINDIKLIDLETEKPLLHFTKTAESNWENRLVNQSEEATTATFTLLKAIQKFPVRRFISDSFTDPIQLDRTTRIPWAFRIEATLQLPGKESDQSQTYYLSDRRSGMTQFAGSKEENVIFELPQSLIDSLHPILFTRPRPDAQTNPTPGESLPVLPVEDTSEPPLTEN